MRSGLSISKGTRKELLPEGKLLRLNDWAEPGGWVVAGVVVLFGVVLLLPPASPSSHLDGSLRPVAGLVWVGLGLMMAGGARSGLIVDHDGIAVQGLWRRNQWRWEEVDAFELKKPFYRPALRIHLADGSRASASGFSPKSVSERSLAEARVTELNRRATEARRSHPGLKGSA